METQDKLASTATVKRETDVFTDLDVLSKKASEVNTSHVQPHFSSGIS